MTRALILLASPLITAGLIFWLGWIAPLVVVALVFGTLLFSTAGLPAERAPAGNVALGSPTTFLAGL